VSTVETVPLHRNTVHVFRTSRARFTFLHSLNTPFTAGQFQLLIDVDWDGPIAPVRTAVMGIANGHGTLTTVIRNALATIPNCPTIHWFSDWAIYTTPSYRIDYHVFWRGAPPSITVVTSPSCTPACIAPLPSGGFGTGVDYIPWAVNIQVVGTVDMLAVRTAEPPGQPHVLMEYSPIPPRA
jgi:hypothetical protein